MQYYGNLALSPERKKQEQQANQRRPKTPPSNRPRRRTIPVGEKLLYLLTVVVFVAVAGLVVYRYAGLYELNREIQTTTSSYEEEAAQTKVLQQEINTLKDPNRIREMATALGMVPISQQETLSSSNGQTATALQP
ncbi:cell division protein FtsL [Cohnella sp. AR92]|uniref:cell division protein FtsL n=1 Tax=Cohnella sp. AR92 TaxID=648716 RepID=UPI0013158771|nr:cell division protein FtsL [Cohnella sp. AR92]